MREQLPAEGHRVGLKKGSLHLLWRFGAARSCKGGGEEKHVGGSRKPSSIPRSLPPQLSNRGGGGVWAEP